MVPCMIGTPGRYDIYLGSVLSRKTTGCSDWVTMRVTNQANPLAYAKRWPFFFTPGLGTVEFTIRFSLFYDCVRYSTIP